MPRTVQLEPFEAVEERHGIATHVVTVRGDLDLYTALDLGEYFRPSRLTGITRLVVDLSNVGFVDDTGLAILIAGHNEMRHRDGEFVIVCTDTRVLRTLQGSGLDMYLCIASSREVALDTRGLRPRHSGLLRFLGEDTRGSDLGGRLAS